MSRRPVALFESWRGRYADSPRAISERLRERYPELRQIWVAGPEVALPEGVGRVRRHSPEYFARLVTCDFLVTNDIVSRHYVKGPRVKYLQTWHGTPLKTIGHDEVSPVYDSGAHHKRMDRDVAKWDALVSPSGECTRMFRSAFRFTGPVLETGYPRNDVLRRPGADRIGRRTREQLGIDASAKVVLYAPTWRDDARDERGEFQDPGGLDVGTFLERTGDDVVLVLRMHSNVATRYGSDAGGRVVDASDVPDIADLYLASDLHVSDYSSTVFDFAVTRRPIVLFPYDLDHYRHGLRRLYFDYEDWAPGPIAMTTEELADAVTAELAREGGPDERYLRFVERFCPHEDGHASDRVIDAFFAPHLG
jgi:CDP-glycerol glycerophosphotransferase